MAFVLGAAVSNAQYTMEWAQTFGGDGWDEANTCIECRDGDFLLGGFAKQQEHQLWLVKVRKDGTGRWGKTFAEYFISAANCAIQTADSNFVITGYAIKKREFQSNLLLMKVDSVGNIIWQKTYGGDSDEQGLKVIECRDGGLAVCGFSSSNNDAEPDWYIIKTDSNGNLLWEKQFGTPNDDRALDIAQTYDDGFVVTGYLGTNVGGQKRMSIVKLEADGNDVWSQRYDMNDWSCGTSIIATRDSMIVAAGYTRTYSITDYDFMILKTDMRGDTIWTRTFGDENWQEGTGLIETYDNSYVASGFSMSNVRYLSSFMTLKYDKDGNLLWHNIFKRKSQDYAKSITETRDNGLLLAGTTFSFGKGWDMAVLKMKNHDRADLVFSFPKDSVSTTLTDKLDLQLCLNSFGVPNLVKISVNGKQQYSESGFSKIPEDMVQKGCDFPLNYSVDLEPGLNVVRVEVFNYKNYPIEKQISVYRIPRYDF